MLQRRKNVLAVAAVILTASLLAACAQTPAGQGTPQTSRSPFAWSTPEPPPPSHPPLPPVPPAGPGVWRSWALLDRANGTISHIGGPSGTSTTESMIKVAVVAQFLADSEAAGRQVKDSERRMLSAILRDSDNAATEYFYRRSGRDAMLAKVFATCGMHTAKIDPGWWSQTQLTPMDAVHMGDCIASGRVASAEETTWLMGEMRSVRGIGLFGISDAYPIDSFGRPLAIKNGWNLRPDGWHVNCLAVTDEWVLAVMTRYPKTAGQTGEEFSYNAGVAYGAALCRDVAQAVIPANPLASMPAPVPAH